MPTSVILSTTDEIVVRFKNMPGDWDDDLFKRLAAAESGASIKQKSRRNRRTTRGGMSVDCTYKQMAPRGLLNKFTIAYGAAAQLDHSPPHCGFIKFVHEMRATHRYKVVAQCVYDRQSQLSKDLDKYLNKTVIVLPNFSDARVREVAECQSLHQFFEIAKQVLDIALDKLIALDGILKK